MISAGNPVNARQDALEGKQLAKFHACPSGETLSKKFRIGRMQLETRDQTSVRAIHFTQHSTFATTTRNLCKTAVIGSHKAKNRANACSRKRRNQQSVLSISEYSGYYAQIVKAEIED